VIVKTNAAQTWNNPIMRMKIRYSAAILFLILGINCSRTFAEASSPETGSRLVSNGDGKAYVVKSDGAIYIVRGKDGSLSAQLQEEAPLQTQPALRHISSIALGPTSDSRIQVNSLNNPKLLYACDAGAGVLYEIEISKSISEAAPAHPVMKDEILKGKCVVAVSEAGLIAVVGRESHVLLTSTGQGRWARKNVKELEAPTELAFAGETLLVLKKGRVFSVDWTADESSGRLGLTSLDRVGPEQTKIRRIATERGLIYALARDAIYVSSSTDPDRVGVGFPYVSDFPSQRGRSDATRQRQLLSRVNEIAVNGDDVLTWDAESERAVNIPRLTPAAISIEGTALQSGSALNAIYQYLYDSGLLITRALQAAKTYDSLRQWLLELGVMLPLGRISKEDQKSADFIESNLGRLLCVLNPSLCKEGGVLTLNRPVQIGSTMTLPFVQKKSHTVVRQRDLNGSSLNDIVAQTAPLVPYSSWYLADLNQANLPTLEATLDRERFLMLTPLRLDVQLGSILQTVDGHEQLIAPGDHCLHTERAEFSFPLPSPAITDAGVQVLPRAVADARGRAPEISSIEITFDNPVVERIVPGKLSNQDVQCLTNEFPITRSNDVFIVTSLLKASGMRYRLIDRKQQVLHPTISQLRSWGLAGQPDMSDKWSVVVSSPSSVAYQAGTLSLETSPIRWQDLTDPAVIKRGSSQDIGSRTQGRFLVPVSTWQLNVLLPQRDLTSNGSELSAIASGTPGVYILPITNLSTSNQSIVSAASGQSGPKIDDVQKTRLLLLNNIHWPIGESFLDEPLARRVILAIGEDGSDFGSWRWLPHFIEEDGQTNVFRDVTDSGEIQITSKPSGLTSTLAGDHVLCKQHPTCDHPAYISALIASRDKAVPGLLPHAGLLLINISSKASAATLKDAIDAANSANVSVVSVSQTINVDNSLLSIKKRITEEGWVDRLLFVTAAGNDEGADVDYLAEHAFITWASLSPQNVLGVAASDYSDDHLIRHCKPDDNSPEQPCSNFGKKYVQLTAPGYRVWGLGEKNEYILESGTSVSVPQVAAAAAMLKAENPLLKPSQLKARLIYTADYNEDYIKFSQVWGGRLNVARALAEQGTSFLVTTSGPNGSKFRVDLDPSSTIEGLNSGEIYDPITKGDHVPNMLPVGKILRLYRTTDNNGTWIVYVDNKMSWAMRMIVHATPSYSDDKGTGLRKLRCYKVEEWDKVAKRFGEVKNHDWVLNGLPIDKIEDLVGPVPSTVKLPE
jgi:hypothetical protein